MYRNELKYLVTNTDLVVLDNSLKHIMKVDPYAKKKKYNIRSIYFDSYDNRCFFENEQGIEERFKMRIRIYNNSSRDIKLEIKYKKNGFSKKDFCLIDSDLCQKLIDGKMINYKECNNKILRKLFIEQRINCFKPKIMVEYERIAYIDYNGNVRVTFDMNIRASRYIQRFLKKETYSRPILDNNLHVLEIKYDEFLPDYIINELKTIRLERVSFSKYYLSRLEFKEEIL